MTNLNSTVMLNATSLSIPCLYDALIALGKTVQKGGIQVCEQSLNWLQDRYFGASSLLLACILGYGSK